MTISEPDPEKMISRTLEIATIRRSVSVAAMICLGVRLGLYPALRDAGSVTSEELANRTGLHERWLREWLRGQAAAGIVEYHGDERFELSPETSVILADEDNLSYLGNQFNAIPFNMEKIEPTKEAFKTGVGISWEQRTPQASEQTGNTFRNWYRQMLVPKALPLLDHAPEKALYNSILLRAGERHAEYTSSAAMEACSRPARGSPTSASQRPPGAGDLLSRSAQEALTSSMPHCCRHHLKYGCTWSDGGSGFLGIVIAPLYRWKSSLRATYG